MFLESKISKSNMLIESRFLLTIIEQRLLLKLVSCISREDPDFRWHTFKISDIIREFGMDETSGYRDLLKAKKGLHEKIIEIPKENGDMLMVSFLCASIDTHDGYMKLQFAPELKPYLLQLENRFTTYKIKYVYGFKSPYSHRIYELLKQSMWKNKEQPQRRITLDDFKYYLNIPENRLYGNIKLIIKTAQKELQEKSDISFIFEELKKGKKVESVLFRMEANELSSHSDNTFNSIAASAIDVTSLPNQIWMWIKKWEDSTGKQMTIFDREPSENNKTISYLNILISKLSESKVRALWNEELAKPTPNPINLLTKRLREELYKAI